MEIDEKKTKLDADPQATKRKYEDFKAQMVVLANKNKIDMKVKYNADIIGSIVMAACTNGAVKETGKYSFFFAKTEGEGWELKEVEVNCKAVIDWAKQEIDDEKRREWNPFLAALQLCMKTEDSILWQRNPVTQELQVSPVCEPFAVGYNIKDKLKKSRPLSVGPLNHLLHWTNLYTEKSVGKGKKLNPRAANGIRARLEATLLRQTIGQSQKAMLRQIFDGKLAYVRTLAHSYCSIKPHIENQFVLPYSVMAVTDSFDDADMSSEWVYKKLSEASTKILLTGPDQSWKTFMAQILIYCTFRCQHEDLGVLTSMFGMIFEPRKARGKFCAAAKLQVLGTHEIAYKFWSKPQRGAPRNLGGARRGQICTRPSFRGVRATYNKYSSLEQLEKACGNPTGENLVEALNQEFEEYSKLTAEGTGQFFEKGSTNEYRGNVQATGQLLFEV